MGKKESEDFLSTPLEKRIIELNRLKNPGITRRKALGIVAKGLGLTAVAVGGGAVASYLLREHTRDIREITIEKTEETVRTEKWSIEDDIRPDIGSQATETIDFVLTFFDPSADPKFWGELEDRVKNDVPEDIALYYSPGKMVKSGIWEKETHKLYWPGQANSVDNPVFTTSYFFSQDKLVAVELGSRLNRDGSLYFQDTEFFEEAAPLEPFTQEEMDYAARSAMKPDLFKLSSWVPNGDKRYISVETQSWNFNANIDSFGNLDIRGDKKTREGGGIII